MSNENKRRTLPPEERVVPVSISLPRRLVTEIDMRRGLQSRGAYVRPFIEAGMAEELQDA